MTTTPPRCGASNPNKPSELCALALHHTGIHYGGNGFHWKRDRVAPAKVEPEQRAEKPAAKPAAKKGQKAAAAPPPPTAPARCDASRNNVWHEPAQCKLTAGHDGDHETEVTVVDGWPETGEVRRIAWDKHGHGKGNEILVERAAVDIDPRPLPSDFPEEPEDDDNESDDPLEDEVRSDADRELSRHMREAREAHERELAAAETTTTRAPSLADACPKCGLELGAHDGKKCPKPEKAPKLSKIYTQAEREALAKKAPVEPPPSTTTTAPLTRIGGYEVHPAAALFPMLADAERDAFLQDLRANGQRRKIVRLDGAILDGRNRLSGCLAIGIEPQFREFGDDPTDGADPIAFVISENISRRHLDETDRSYIGAELVPMYEAQAKERQRAAGGVRPVSANLRGAVAEKASEAAARAVNVSPRSIEHALKVKREAAPELLAASRAGQAAVSAAAELSKLPMQKQREELAKAGGKKITIGKARSIVNQAKKRETVQKINKEQVAPMPVGPFRVIVVDWPWPYDNSDQHEGSRGHVDYPTLTVAQALAMAPEIQRLAHEEGCILGFWVTNAFMFDAADIVRAWGFSLRTIRTWDKGRDGIGTWCRGRTEHLIIAERGQVEAHTLNEVSTYIGAPRREHSRKPDEPMEVFEKHCPGPHVELFAREPRPLWASWGAEANKFATEAA